MPAEYAHTATSWFFPLAENISRCRQSLRRSIVVGINGCQGSGKSTLGALLVQVLMQQYDLNAASLSIDDFYLTREQREQLSQIVHPLLLTRGVPGTHDTGLALDILAKLRHQHGEVAVPRFDKASDDRVPRQQWPLVEAPLDIVVFEGWCLGAHAQPAHELQQPVNELEEKEDTDGRWRTYVNQQLLWNYPALFAEVDFWIMLKAPSFDCVFDWRLEQEEKMAHAIRQKQENMSELHVMQRDDVARFIQYYQRITEYTLKKMPQHVHFLFELDEQREIVKFTTPVKIDCGIKQYQPVQSL